MILQFFGFNKRYVNILIPKILILCQFFDDIGLTGLTPDPVSQLQDDVTWMNENL